MVVIAWAVVQIHHHDSSGRAFSAVIEMTDCILHHHSHDHDNDNGAHHHTTGCHHEGSTDCHNTLSGLFTTHNRSVKTPPASVTTFAATTPVDVNDIPRFEIRERILPIFYRFTPCRYIARQSGMRDPPCCENTYA